MNQVTRNLLGRLPHSQIAVLVEKPENRRYLSGFTGSAGFLVITKGMTSLITDGRYADQARAQAEGWNVVVHKGDVVSLVGKLLQEQDIQEVWFDALFTSFDLHKRLEDVLVPEGVQLIPQYDLIESLRQVKSDDELIYIDQAFDITNRAFDYIFGELHAGLSEHQVSWMLERYMREAGAEKIKENHVIASGPRSALPHGRATNRIIEQGDLLTMDIGAVVNGYYADMTRTVVIGKPDQRQVEIYRLVLEAQLLALDLMRPGTVCGHADDTIREFFKKQGVAEYFAHTLGHAVGLEIHERPGLRGSDTTILQAGHVITVEPGLYFPGWGGVRIEDPVVITSSGHRNLATVTKELLSL
ncbi:aminopeptidase P family protein [Alicyclobacillus curvatus]|nr:aminopeptidase P family protein [Alicyclobacillus curvatus]